MATRTQAAAALLVALALLAGCGGGTSTNSEGGNTPLAKAVDSVTSGDAARSSFGFTDLARLRALGIISRRGHGGPPVDPRWGQALVGLAPLATALRGKPLGLEPFAADTAVAIGSPPHVAVRLDGASGKAAARALRRLGAKSSPWPAGGTLYSIGSEGTLQTRGSLSRLGTLGIADRVAVGNGRVSLSPYEDSLAAVDGQGDPLSDGPAQAAAVSCLGDVVAAQFVSGAEAQIPGVEQVAVGIRAPDHANDATQEVLCAADASAEAADAQAGALKNAFAPGRIDPLTGSRMGRYVGSSSVDRSTSGDIELARATITLRPAAKPGYLFIALQNGGVEGFLKGTPPPDVG